MSTSPSFPDLLRLSHRAVEQYMPGPSAQTFGQWLLAFAYPDVDPTTLRNGRDFCGAQRTNDGRTYLLGMLMSGALPATPLQQRLA